MKKNFIFLVFFIISCSMSCKKYSIESDAEKLVELQCKIKKLQENARAGDMYVKEEIERLVLDTITLSKEKHNCK